MNAPSNTEPISRAERRRVAWVRFRNRVRGSAPGRFTNVFPFFLHLPRLFVGIAAVPVAVAVEAIDLWQRAGYAASRVARLDAAIDQERAAKDSPYCRAVFGVGPLYTPCASGERHSFVQFARAWTAGKRLSTITSISGLGGFS